MSTAVVFGGYGTFGLHVVRELVRLGIAVVVAGRDARRAEALAAELGRPHRWVAADVNRLDECRRALEGRHIAVNCAGPYSAQTTALLDACLEQGCHYADLADDRAYVARVRSYGERFGERGLSAVYGCSSLPGISGALALRAAAISTEKPRHARVSLFIGNNNPKGLAAVQSLMQTLGQPIAAPQGPLRGFRDREVIPFPAPVGPRSTFNVSTPEYDLFPDHLGAASVVVKAGLEFWPGMFSLALLAALRVPCGKWLSWWLVQSGKPFQRFGASGGAVMAELFYAGGSRRWAALVARSGGQVMAALPCAFAVEALCNTANMPAGAVTAYELLGAQTLLDRLVAEGYELHES
jgi:hypothetical protein